MKIDPSRDVLLVHALESADSAGEIDALSPTDRALASKEADGNVEARAQKLREGLEKKHGAVRNALSATKGHGWIGWALVVVCLIVGFFSNKLGDQKIIDVLAFPLLGLVAWNLLVYFFILIGRLKKGSGPGWMTKLFEAIGERAASKKIAVPEEGALAKGLRNFAANWLQVTAASRESRIRAMLHLAAAVLVAGVVGGMYWKGLAVEYKAGWESTFISKPEPVQQFYGVLFKPASAVSGIPAPTLEEVGAARSGQGDAAKWIHLFALTVLLFVFVPRLLLAIFSWRRARRLESDLDVESVDPHYFRRLEKINQGGNAVALVVPHRIDPKSSLREAVRMRLHDLWGGALVIEFAESVGYGDEEDAQECIPKEHEITYIVPLMSLASTPEDESQGLLVDTLKAAAPDAEILVLLDPASFIERLEGLPEKDRRLKEREEAWERMLDGRSVSSGFLTKVVAK